MVMAFRRCFAICAAFLQQKGRQRFDLLIGDCGADNLPSFLGLLNKTCLCEDFHMMGQRRSRHTGPFTKDANSQSLFTSADKDTQDGQSLFGPKG